MILEVQESISWETPTLIIETVETTESIFEFFRCS